MIRPILAPLNLVFQLLPSLHVETARLYSRAQRRLPTIFIVTTSNQAKRTLQASPKNWTKSAETST
jgi:hypothetical protein